MIQFEEVCREREGPFFIYDIDQLKVHLKKITDVIDPKEIKLWYACKANPLSSLLHTLADFDFSFDIASLGELSQVKALQKDILMTGPAKSKKTLTQAFENGVNTFVIESVQQLHDTPKGAKILLRFQLLWKQEGNNVLGGNDITVFGLSPSDWMHLDPSLLKDRKLIGFHCFQWGNILSADHLYEIWKVIAEESLKLARHFKIKAPILDLGGGLGIPYQENEQGFNWAQAVMYIQKLKNKYQLSQVWLELGRYAVGECGYYLAQVIDKKEVYGQSFLILEGGMNHLIRQVLTKKSFPCHLARQSTQMTHTFQVHGPLCSALDRLGTYELPDDTSAGDWLVFSQCGAYGFTESMPFFLCHNLPAELVQEKETIKVIRETMKAEEWLR